MKSLKLCLMAGTILFLYACSGGKTEEETEGETNAYPVIQPIVKSTTNQLEYVAEINAQLNVEIRAKIKGYVEKVYIDEGQRVKRGQLLFSISNTLSQQELTKAQAQVKMAEADLKAIQIELENAIKLNEKDIISKAELKLAEAKVEAAVAKVAEMKSEEERARLHVSFSQITAPFNGTINRLPHKAGSLLEEGTLLTTLSNSEEVFAYFNVSEKDYLDLVTSRQTGISRPVSLVLANGTEYAHPGIIETTESEFDKSTGNLAFRARFKNPEGILKHGGSGKVIIRNPVENAIHIPQKSTFEVQDKLYVFVLNKKNELEQRSIEPDFRIPHYYIVSEGISAGDRILFEGLQEAKEGEIIDAELISQEKAEERINQ